MKLQIVAYTLGVLITALGLAELIPAIIDWRAGHDNAYAFLLNSFIAIFFGGSLLISNRGHKADMNLRQTFLLTALSWLTVSVFGALPFVMSDIDVGFIDAFFESTSAITTTGSTVLTGLDDMSRGILFWRSLMQWMGGIGVIAFAVVLLPYLKVGGMQIFRTVSSSAHDQKALPRSSEIMLSLIQIYIGLTIACGVLYYIFGMSSFDALNHAMTTLSTGGFSTHDASFSHFTTPALQYTAILFMLLSALPFVLYIRLFFQKRFLFLKDEQIKALLLSLAGFVTIMTIWALTHTNTSFEETFRSVLFSAVSIITTAGYTTVDYTAWGGFAALSFLMLVYVGACTGSTSGGIKMMRVIVLLKVVSRQFKNLLYPSGVFIMDFQGQRLNNQMITNILGFLSFYVLTNVLVTIALSFTGLDFKTALSAAATTLANVGPGIGDTIGPRGNFSSLPESAKWVLCFSMLLGRLEILTVLVLFSKTFWRR